MIKLDNDNILITSDWHLGHTKDFVWGKRGFSSSEEHDRCIIDCVNHMLLSEDDIIIHLGDIAVGQNYEHQVRKLLQIYPFKRMYHIIGNHDTDNKLLLYKELLGDKYECLGYADILSYKKWKFYLSHIPLMYGQFAADTKKVCLCGHQHTQDKFNDLAYSCYHCELDAHDNYPVRLNTIIDQLNKEKSKLQP